MRRSNSDFLEFCFPYFESILGFTGFCMACMLIFYPAGFPEFLMQQPFNLPIHTTEFITRPFFQGLIGFIVDTYHKTFFVTHYKRFVFVNLTSLY